MRSAPLSDIGVLGAICREHGVYFHTDAVQAPAYMPIDVNALNVDLLSLSAHKFYGPKGIGVLYMRDGTPYLPTSTGGGHERGRRPGTVNVAGAVGAAAALKYVARERVAQSERLRGLREKLVDGILAAVPDSRLSGHPDRSSARARQPALQTGRWRGVADGAGCRRHRGEHRQRLHQRRPGALAGPDSDGHRARLGDRADCASRWAITPQKTILLM